MSHPTEELSWTASHGRPTTSIIWSDPGDLRFDPSTFMTQMDGGAREDADREDGERDRYGADDREAQSGHHGSIAHAPDVVR